MTGFFKAPPEAWPAIAEVIPTPWPDDAIRMDIAWWSDRERLGHDRPGARCLAKRWGVTHWKARRMCSAHLPHRARTEPAQSPHTHERAEAVN